MSFLARWNKGGIWSGYEGQDTWEPERSLKRQGCEESIRDFLMRSGHNPSDDFIADQDDV